MSITEDADILPLAILSDPLMAAEVDLVTNGSPFFTRPEKIRHMGRTIFHGVYLVIFLNFGNDFPLYSLFSTERPIINQQYKPGRTHVHIWFALRDWLGEDLEGYFGRNWAEKRVKDLGINGS